MDKDISMSAERSFGATTETEGGVEAQDYEQVLAELADAKDQLLRKAAEFQNFRRRAEEARASDLRLGKFVVLREMLDVYDDLARTVTALATVGGNDSDSEVPTSTLGEGVELVYRKFGDALARLGVEKIAAVGHPFDESLHEALMQQPAPEGVAPGTIVEEIQPGYKMGERVIRHTRVSVAS